MLQRCLFCQTPFHRHGVLGGFPSGSRVAYDPGRGRLWAICDRCHGWTLTPMEDRWRILSRLERLARDRGRLLTRTAHIALLDAGDLLLIRVGRDTSREEEAWWRFGRELRRRRDDYLSPGTRLAAYAYGAVAHLGGLMGFTELEAPAGWDDRPTADLLRWRRFGWAAWYGRAPCPYCGSVLRLLRYDISWWSYPLADEEGRLGLGVPCSRCDPWTPEKLHVLRGSEGEEALRRVLAYQNVAGVGDDALRTAVRAIEEAGSADAFTRQIAERRSTLWRSGEAVVAALEIAASETVEHRLLRAKARALELRWEREERLARISDEELTPVPGGGLPDRSGDGPSTGRDAFGT